MEYSFSSYQMAEMAMQVEEEGARFYNRLSGLIDDDKIKNIFLFLSKQELKHKASFRAIADAAKTENSAYEYSINIYEQMENSLNRLKAVAFDMRSFTKSPFSIKKALEIAIHTENEAIRIYTEMIKTFVERFRDVLSKIIKEERKHLEILTNVEDRISSKS